MDVLHDGNLPVISLKGSQVHQLYNLYILTKLSPSVCECEFLCATDSSLGDEILSGDSQVWSATLNTHYVVGFTIKDQCKRCVFTSIQSRFVSVVHDNLLGSRRLAGHT